MLPFLSKAEPMENEPRHASGFMSREIRGSGIWWPKEGFLYQWNTTWGSLDHGITRAEALITYDPSLLTSSLNEGKRCSQKGTVGSVNRLSSLIS